MATHHNPQHPSGWSLFVIIGIGVILAALQYFA
jgi:hypothetical protein